MSKINYIKLIEEAEEVRTVEIENMTDFYNQVINMKTNDVLEYIKKLREKNIDLYFKDKKIHSINPNSDIFLSIIITLIENEIAVRKERRKKKQNIT